MRIITIFSFLWLFMISIAFGSDEEKWILTKNQSRSLSSDLYGRDSQYDFWENPVSFSSASVSQPYGCNSIAKGNEITVIITDSEGSVVNIKANQEQNGKVKSECNNFRTQKNYYNEEGEE